MLDSKSESERTPSVSPAKTRNWLMSLGKPARDFEDKYFWRKHGERDRIKLISLTLSLLVGLGIFVYWFSTKVAPLGAGGFNPIHLEFAWTSSRAAKIVATWNPTLAWNVHLADCGFALLYGTALFFWTLCYLRIFPYEERYRWGAICWAAPLAALFDLAENAILLFVIKEPSGLVALAGVFACAKFILLAVTFISLAVLAIAKLQANLLGSAADQYEKDSSKSPDEGKCLDANAVANRERVYLAQRRALLANSSRPQKADELMTTGLAMSGGGVRSATINLGALDALSETGVLPRMDYMSTVSGGGYIGSALSSLLSRKSGSKGDSGRDAYEFGQQDQPIFDTEPDHFPLRVEGQATSRDASLTATAPIRHLRNFADFLIRRKGLFHRDVLRTVGALLGGVAYHLLLFVLFLFLLSAFYLASTELLLTPSAAEQGIQDLRGLIAESGSLAELREHFSSKSLALNSAATGTRHIFGQVVLLGLLITLLLTPLCSSIFWALPARWFRKDHEPDEETRQVRMIWVCSIVTLLFASLAAKIMPVEGPPLLALPLGYYMGGALASILLHQAVALFNGDRDRRSRYASSQGIFYYLMLLSLPVLGFPWALNWMDKHLGAFSGSGLLTWLSSGVAARFLQRFGGKAGPKDGLLKKLWSVFHKLLLALLVTVMIFGGLIWSSTMILKWDPTGNWWIWLGGASLCVLARALRSFFFPKLKLPLLFRYADFALPAVAFWLFVQESPNSPEVSFLSTFFISCGALVLSGYLFNFNRLSFHYFYRDRLVETYMQTFGSDPSQSSKALQQLRDDSEIPLTHLHGIDPDKPKQAVTAAPLHLVCTCLNLTATLDLRRRTRRSDVFTFSRLFCGSATTGYVPTDKYRTGSTKLARAMGISGAAVSTAMGHRTFFAQSFAMTLFNARLGQWMENPRFTALHRMQHVPSPVRFMRKLLGQDEAAPEQGIFWPVYILRELFGMTNANQRLVHLSDGGHSGDNLGLVPLLQRRCRLIVALDAEKDQSFSFDSLDHALRQIRIDNDTQVDIDLSSIRPKGDPPKDPNHVGTSERNWAVGRIRYPDGQYGFLVVVKSSRLQQESDELVTSYMRENPEFPHQSTVDLFFDETQFEAHRLVGYHMSKRMASKLGFLFQGDIGTSSWQSDVERELGQLGIQFS